MKLLLKNIVWDKIQNLTFNEIVYNDCDHIHNNEPYELWISSLFETKKEAELHLEFVGIKREEEFPYVSWEEFKKTVIEPIKDANGRLFIIDISSSIRNTIHLKYLDDENAIFTKPLTEENYYEALRLQRNCFLGEEV